MFSRLLGARPKRAAGATLAFLAAVAAAGLLWIRPYFTNRRTFYASVAAPVALNAAIRFTLRPGGVACLDGVTLPRTLGFVSVHVSPDGTALGPPVQLTAYADGYKASTVVPGGYAGGEATLPLKPPARTEIGAFCFTDIGRLPVALVGNDETRGLTRSELFVEGHKVPGVVALSFFTHRPQPLAQRLLPTAQHAARLIDNVFSPSLLLAIGVLVLGGIPLLVVGAVAWMEGDASGRARHR